MRPVDSRGSLTRAARLRAESRGAPANAAASAAAAVPASSAAGGCQAAAEPAPAAASASSFMREDELRRRAEAVWARVVYVCVWGGGAFRQQDGSKQAKSSHMHVLCIWLHACMLCTVSRMEHAWMLHAASHMLHGSPAPRSIMGPCSGGTSAGLGRVAALAGMNAGWVPVHAAWAPENTEWGACTAQASAHALHGQRRMQLHAMPDDTHGKRALPLSP